MARTQTTDPKRRERIAAAIGVALVLASMWTYGLVLAAHPYPTRAATLEYLNELPDLREDSADATLYRHTVRRVHDGEGYYEALTGVLRLNNHYDTADIDLSTPLSYRLPTMYVVLGMLPATGLAYVMATLTVGSLAAVSAFLLARRYARLPVALGSMALVGLLYGGFADSVAQFGTEVWAGALGLLSVSLIVRSSARRAEGRVASGAMWAAAGVALAATAVRELAVAFVLLGIVATLADRDARRSRAWVPWVLALVLAGAVYAAHVAALRPFMPPDAATAAFRFRWFDPTGAGLVAMIVRDTHFFSLYPAVGWVTLALGIIGGTTAPRRALERVALGLVVVGGPLVLALFHPPGTGYLGTVPGYWSDLVMPTILACAPLSLLLVPRLGRAVTPHAEDADDAA